MNPEIVPTSLSVLYDILKWSGDRPDWQRDALRRIISQELISESDISELNIICRFKHSLTSLEERDMVEFEPLSAMHLPPAMEEASSVTLVSVGNLRNVNRLHPDQVLDFGGSPGLTIVFGDNGSGKSGYARVVKKACRTRGIPPRIRPNAFQPTPDSPPSAEVIFQTANSKHTFIWTDGTSTDHRLTNIFVFDSATANHYLQEDGPATFTPSGLDVLPRLSQVCDRVRTLILNDIDTLQSEISVVERNWQYDENTHVGRVVKSLSARTKHSDLDSLAIFGAEDEQRLRETSEALKSDPRIKSKETRASALRLKSFVKNVAAVKSSLSVEHLKAVKTTFENAVNAEETARSFTSTSFDDSYLAGTGGGLWRQLFDAARAYSVGDAYKDSAFPVTSDNARCLLCQQNLDSSGRARLEAFDKFCKDTSQQYADAAIKELNEIMTTFHSLPSLRNEYLRVEADLSHFDEVQDSGLSTFVSRCEEILENIKSSVTSRKWQELGDIPSFPLELIEDHAQYLERRAELEESVVNPDTRAKLLSEQSELIAKQWLARVKEDVVTQVNRHKRLAALNACLKDTSTRGITDKSTEITNQVVTGAFCKRFESEAKIIGLRTLTVRMEGIQGKKGETRFGLRLDGASSHKVSDIASEGEQRCIALAAFMAELSQASHRSSLVFDDPVSSLDHWHHQKIAIRLTQEAISRQVIVFTHSTSFLHDLQQAANELNIEPQIRHLEWDNGAPGRCREGLPWDWKSPNDRFDKLEKLQRELRDKWNPYPNDDNIQDMRRAYSWLRATLERIVEKEVFSDVLFRFRAYIKVQNLNGVVGFSYQECEEIQRLMQRCHDITEAHDQAFGKSSFIPDPSDFLNDITQTKNVYNLIKQRKKQTPKSASSATYTF